MCLRDVGFTLEKIHRTLGDCAVSVLSALERHLESLDDEIQKKQRLLKKLGTTADFLRAKNKIDLLEILAVTADIISKIWAEMDRGAPPQEPNVRSFAKRWTEIGVAFSGGDPSLKEA